MSTPDYISKVAIIGASGHVGKHFATALLKTGRHTVTAISRTESTATFPEGVQIARVDYSDHSTLVSAFRGQHFLIITLPARAPPDLHSTIVKAAIEAGVNFIMPNAYGGDHRNPKLTGSDPFTAGISKNLQEIVDLGGAYVVESCGLWYEWSLACGEQWFGFDIRNRTATFNDDGKTVIRTSTWQQCGRALAGFLSLPVHKTASGGLAIEEYKNDRFIVESFRVSQRDMLDSLHRVLGTTDADWEIKYESTQKRIEDGERELQNGDFRGFAKQLYARYLNPEVQDLVTEGIEGKLGLPKESLDEATKRAVEMVESGWNPFA